MSEDAAMTLSELANGVVDLSAQSGDRRSNVTRVEHLALHRALRRVRYSLAKAARLLNMSEDEFHARARYCFTREELARIVDDSARAISEAAVERARKHPMFPSIPPPPDKRWEELVFIDHVAQVTKDVAEVLPAVDVCEAREGEWEFALVFPDGSSHACTGGVRLGEDHDWLVGYVQLRVAEGTVPAGTRVYEAVLTKEAWERMNAEAKKAAPRTRKKPGRRPRRAVKRAR